MLPAAHNTVPNRLLHVGAILEQLELKTGSSFVCEHEYSRVQK